MEILSVSYIEWVGYAAMVVLLASFIMKNVVKLRIVNTIGCVLFVAYGLLLNVSWPIVISNAAIICVNLYYLVKKI
ncbi:MAG: uroporphyrinogen decarboxylase [Flavobacteriaceae bacterium]